jgi:hypothetical protein
VSAVVVPAALIDLIRDGLRGQISVAAAELVDAEALGRRGSPERYLRPLDSIGLLRALLDEVGWETPAVDRQIDLDMHGWALVRSIDDRIQVLIDRLAEIDRRGPGESQPRAALVSEASELCKLALATMMGLGQRAQTGQPTKSS